VRKLIERLEKEGREVVFTREPGGTPTGEILRKIIQHNESGEVLNPAAELLLFSASRAQLVANVIQPALKRGACVVSDRFADSTTAYQGHGRGFPIDQVLAINEFAIGGAVPDLTILLDIPVDESMARLIKEHASYDNLDTIERETRDFHQRVRDGYHEVAASDPNRVEVVDGCHEPDHIAEMIWRLVSSRLA
jgi:dTMP kinase